MNGYERLSRQAERYKKQYPPGTRIELIEMEDPFAPVPSGTRGTVKVVDDIGQLHMHWDKETVDYSEKQKKFSKTEVFKKPWEVKQKLFASMELRLDAAIDKVENLSRDVEIDGMMKQYDNLMEQAHERQNMAVVAEPGEVYGDDLFEAAIASESVKECIDKKIKPQMIEKSR